MMTISDGDDMKALKNIFIGLAALFLGLIGVYWFNLDNKLIFYVVRPVLNRIYDRKPRDVRL